jgi:hypothetical protein
MNNLFEFFQEDNGGFSMARLVVFMMTCLYFFQGCWQIVYMGKIDLNWQDIAAVIGPFFVKAHQKQYEEKFTPGPSQEGNK